MPVDRGAVGVVAGVTGAETADPFCSAAVTADCSCFFRASSIACSASFSCVSRRLFVSVSRNLKPDDQLVHHNLMTNDVLRLKSKVEDTLLRNLAESKELIPGQKSFPISTARNNLLY